MSDFEIDRDADLPAEMEEAVWSVLAAPELDAEDVAALSGRIAHASALPLARRRAAYRPRTARAVRWLRPLLPLTAAALLVLVLARPDGGDASPAADLGVAERALLAEVSDAEFARLVSGAEEAEALLLMAVSVQ
jgi:hypothetical protein